MVEFLFFIYLYIVIGFPSFSFLFFSFLFSFPSFPFVYCLPFVSLSLYFFLHSIQVVFFWIKFSPLLGFHYYRLFCFYGNQKCMYTMLYNEKKTFASMRACSNIVFFFLNSNTMNTSWFLFLFFFLRSRGLCDHQHCMTRLTRGR